jgi:hypothetical protein
MGLSKKEKIPKSTSPSQSTSVPMRCFVLKQLLISRPDHLGMSREDLLQLSPWPCTLSKQVHLPDRPRSRLGKQLGCGKRGNLPEMMEKDMG